MPHAKPQKYDLNRFGSSGTQGHVERMSIPPQPVVLRLFILTKPLGLQHQDRFGPRYIPKCSVPFTRLPKRLTPHSVMPEPMDQPLAR